jgi:NAD(P)H-hydrate epimerase
MKIESAAKIVSTAEMREIERAADASGCSYAAMMEAAGAAVARAVRMRYGFGTPSVIVLAGPGNNGGDGLVCARHLHENGVQVHAYLWKRRTGVVEDFGGHFARLQALGVEYVHADADPEYSILTRWLTEGNIVVDALLGTGANRPVEGQLAAILTCVQRRLAQVSAPLMIAVDCPSGLHCDTGAVDPLTLPAAQTVTFGWAKWGHYRFPGANKVGDLVVADIGVPAEAGDAIKTFVITDEIAAAWLPPRPRVSHKGSFGKLLAVVGSMNYPGAGSLACAAAQRVGVGLVTGAVPEPVWPISAGKVSESTWLPLPADLGAITPAAADVVKAALPGYDAFLVGCGLTRSPGVVEAGRQMLAAARRTPTLIDADGLNCLAQMDGWPGRLPEQVVLTPHLAEMARLCQMSIAEVGGQTWELARAKAVEWHCVVLLKGPYTVIAEPGGWLGVLPVATPALATAGTGDVLAGVIAGLLAQGVEPFAAACLGAWLHGWAGLRCERKIGPAGAVASDLLLQIPKALGALRRCAKPQQEFALPETL